MLINALYRPIKHLTVTITTSLEGRQSQLPRLMRDAPLIILRSFDNTYKVRFLGEPTTDLLPKEDVFLLTKG